MAKCNVLSVILLMYCINGMSLRQVPVYILTSLVNTYPCIIIPCTINNTTHQQAMYVDNTIYLKAMYTDNKTTLPQLYTDSDTVNKIQLTIIYALRYPVEITYIICLSTQVFVSRPTARRQPPSSS